MLDLGGGVVVRGLGVVAVLLGLPAALGAARADQPEPSEQQSTHAPRAVEKVTVTATRQKRNADEVPATVTVITSKEIEDNLAADIKDVVRFEPGVSVRANPSRFSAASSSLGRDGNSGFNVRGLEGNRVLIQIDGIRVPDDFSFGPQTVGRGDYLDLDILKSIEILRGPASALYGSDGVAGAISFITKDPEDVIDEGETVAARLRASYASADDTWSEGAMAAAQTESGTWQGLLAYTRRDGHESENHGKNDAQDSTRTAANPQDVAANTVFAKLVFLPDADNRFRLTYEYFDRTLETEVLSARAVVPSSAATNVIDLDARDETTRNRVSLDHRFEGDGFVSNAFWALYYQAAETRQFSDEDRFSAADRARDSRYDNFVWGAAGQIENNFVVAGVANSLICGFEYSLTHQSGSRDGTIPPAGETFPTLLFPVTDFTLAGVFIQDEISLAGGKLRLYPALRFDYFKVEPEPSPLYAGAIADQKDEHLTPKLGAIYWPTDRFGVFANYAVGFKAPAPSQVNNSFSSIALDLISIPNPNLKPETSETYEAGVRVRNIDIFGATSAASATVFLGQYEDFIDRAVVAGDPFPTPGGATTVFQFINVGSVDISGVEARIDARWASGFSVTAATSFVTGDQTLGGLSTPLQTVDPWHMVAGLRYDDPADVFGGQAIATHVAKKDPSRVTQTSCAPSPACYIPDGFTILDVTAYWNVTPQATLRAGVFNVFDERYAWWGDVRGLGSPTTIADAFTQPGRNASVSLTLRF